MSRSLPLFRRTLRPALMYAFLLVSIQATAGVLAAPATPSSTTYTRSASCAGLDFYPLSSDTEYGASGSLRTGDLGGASAFFLCDPGLPNGAVVRKVRFTVKDLTVNGQVYDCALVRSGLTAATSTTVAVLASVPGTGTAATPGTLRLSTSDISHATVDNSRYGYWLQCRIYWDDAQAGLFGADVTYTINSTKG